MTFEQATKILQHCKDQNGNRELGVLMILRDTNGVAFDEITGWLRELETSEYPSEKILSILIRGEREPFDAALQAHFDNSQGWEATRERLSELCSDSQTPFGMKP